MSYPYKKLLKNKSLFAQLSICITVFALSVAVVLFLLMRLFAASYTVDRYLEKYLVYVHKDFAQNISQSIQQLNTRSINLTTDSRIYSILANPALSHEAKHALVKPIADMYLGDSFFIENIIITTKYGEVFSFSKKPQLDFELGDTSFINKSNNYDIFFDKHCRKDSEGTNYIVFGKKFKNFNTTYDLGYLEIYVPEDYIYSIYKSSVLNESETFLLYDNYIISHSDKSYLGANMYIADILLTPDKIVKSHDGKYMINIHHFNIAAMPDFAMVSIVSKKAIYNQINDFSKNSITFLIIALALFWVIAFFGLRNLPLSIQKLSEKLIVYGHGEKVDFSQPISTEIMALEKGFENMTIEIDGLIQKNAEEKRLQKVAELAALQAQINPHFIYNALDAICWTAKIKKQPEIERIVYALASFFRISLHKGENIITIDEEIRHVKSYLTIEQIRFPNKFTVDFEISEDILALQTIKIILQPLVENSIKHGFDNLNRTGHIKICGYKQDDDIIFTITDNGHGMDFDPLTRRHKSDFQNGYGIYNVQDRIILEYGEGYGLSYESIPKVSTTVTVKIKCRVKDEQLTKTDDGDEKNVSYDNSYN